MKTRLLMDPQVIPMRMPDCYPLPSTTVKEEANLPDKSQVKIKSN